MEGTIGQSGVAHRTYVRDCTKTCIKGLHKDLCTWVLSRVNKFEFYMNIGAWRYT